MSKKDHPGRDSEENQLHLGTGQTLAGQAREKTHRASGDLGPRKSKEEGVRSKVKFCPEGQPGEARGGGEAGGGVF